MIDTNLKMASRFNQLIMAKTPEERLSMGCSMFDTAREIVKNAILNENAGISPIELKEEIFLRFYSEDFDRVEREKILNALRQSF